MPKEWVDERVRESLLFESQDREYRVWGGFFCVGLDLIRLDNAQEVLNNEGEWEHMDGRSSPLNLLRAKMVREELEEVVRRAEHPHNLGWRLVRLDWKPTINVLSIDGVTVGLEGARLLLKQLNEAILQAEKPIIVKAEPVPFICGENRE